MFSAFLYIIQYVSDLDMQWYIQWYNAYISSETVTNPTIFQCEHICNGNLSLSSRFRLFRHIAHLFSSWMHIWWLILTLVLLNEHWEQQVDWQQTASSDHRGVKFVELGLSDTHMHYRQRLCVDAEDLWSGNENVDMTFITKNNGQPCPDKNVTYYLCMVCIIQYNIGNISK